MIPLVEAALGSRRQTSFIPVVGYDAVEGFYIKARIGFGATETYYGYYRVEYFTKRGLGLGYVAYIGAKDAHRYTTIDSYTISDRIQQARQTNVNIADTETFSKRVRAQFGANYNGDFGPTLALPASLNVTGSIVHQGNASTENVTFSRFLQGTLSDNLNLAFIDSLTLSPSLQQQVNLTYSKFNSPTSTQRYVPYRFGHASVLEVRGLHADVRQDELLVESLRLRQDSRTADPPALRAKAAITSCRNCNSRSATTASARTISTRRASKANSTSRSS